MWSPIIGENAGKIWQVLSKKGQPALDALKKDTGLNEKNLYLALGWLAREENIVFKESQKQVFVNLKQ